MLTLSFSSTMQAVLQVVIMASCGYVFARKRLLNEQGLEVLSNLVIRLFLPCLIIDNLTTHFKFQDNPQWWKLPLYSFGIMAGGFALATALSYAFRSSSFTREYKALSTFQNAGYMPMVIIMALPLADKNILLTYVFLFIMTFDLGVWSIGFWMITGSERTRFNWRKLLNPPFVTTLCTIVAIAIGLDQWIPAMLRSPLNVFGRCTLPLAMIIVGGNLAQTVLSLKNVRQVLAVVLTKLIVFPLIVVMSMKILQPVQLIGLFLVLESSMPSAVSLSIIAQGYHTPHREFVNQSILCTHLASVITIPLMMWIYGL